MQTGKWVDPLIYGIDWNADDDEPKKQVKKTSTKTKSSMSKLECTIDGCKNRVSAEKGKPKPWCKDHVFESPYVQDMLQRYAELDDKEDRRIANEKYEAEVARQEAEDE